MSRGIKLANGQVFDFSRLATKTIDISGPFKTVNVSAIGPADAAIGNIVWASASSSGGGSSSVSVSSFAASDSSGSFTSVSVSTSGEQTSISARLFSDSDLF